MGAITNLYLIPPSSPETLSARDVLAALLRKGFLIPKLVVGPARMSKYSRGLTGPQMVAYVRPWEAFSKVSHLHETEDEALSALAQAPTEPTIYAFVCLNAAHPANLRDFDHLSGTSECAVAAYAIAEGHRLTLSVDQVEFNDLNEVVSEKEEILFDETLQHWIHLQGKLAPWRDQYFSSELSGEIEALWPEHRVIEISDP